MKMATNEFSDWLTKRLVSHEIDPEVYMSYICGILEEENVEATEIEESLTDILSSFVEEPERLSKEVFSQWTAMCCSKEESQTAAEASKSTIDEIVAAHNTKKINEKVALQDVHTDEDKADKLAMKKALLEKYSEVEENIVEEDVESSVKTTSTKTSKSNAPTVDSALSMFKNLNTASVADAEKKQREKQKEESTKKKEKDKMDRERVKTKKDERKEKEKKRTQKKERGR